MFYNLQTAKTLEFAFAIETLTSCSFNGPSKGKKKKNYIITLNHEKLQLFCKFYTLLYVKEAPQTDVFKND